MELDCMSTEKLVICVIDNGSKLLLNRTLESLYRQTEKSFSWKVLDCSAFWTASRNVLSFDANYVMYLYSGSRLEEKAVEIICHAIENASAPWLYFDEKTYSAEINTDIFGIHEKPDFDPLEFPQEVYTGEGVVFSRAILDGMRLKYEGSNFAVALTEMTIAAAAQADGAHIRGCLMTRHNKCQLFPDEEDLLAEALKDYLEVRELGVLGVRGDGLSLHLFPARETHSACSIIILSDFGFSTDELRFSHLCEDVEVIQQSGAMSYGEKCLLGAQKASHEILCFLEAGCIPTSREDFQTMLYYASLPYAGFVSPCLYQQNTFIYTGVFSYAGKPLRVERTEENVRQIGRDIWKIRQTSLPASQFWMASREVLLQAAAILEKNSVGKALSAADWIMECAYQMKVTGKQNLYLGSIMAECTYDFADDTPAGFFDLLYGRKEVYLLDPCCPTAIRSWMRGNVLKGVKAYFPEHMMPPVPGSKKVFVLSHELSLTGAPVVLAHAVRILKESNWQVVVASPTDGMLREEFLREGIPVLILGDLDENTDWLRCASDSDLILVNTIVLFRQIEQLRSSSIPVMWWLHDAKSGYEDYLQFVLPETVSENIHIFSVSQYADDALKQYRPKYSSQLLLYGLKDEAPRVNATKHPFPLATERKVFVCVGTIIKRKGQDVLAHAVRLLPAAVRSQCLFLFVGKCIDRDIFQQVMELEQDFPEDVQQIDVVPHDDIFSLYKHAAAVICSSRDDPLPTFMAETMMVSGVCICSENTGTAAVIHNGINGYVYKNDDPAELAECICQVAECEDFDAMRKASRRTFEEVFSMDIFRDHLLDCAAQCMESKEVVIDNE